MTSRIYDGYHRRYNFWCLNYHKNPKDFNTLLEYKKYLTEEKNLSPRYIKGVTSSINRKWFSKTSNRIRQNHHIERANRKLSLTDMDILLEDSLSNYESDETSLVILLVSLIPNIRPTHLLQKINNPRERRSIELHDILDYKDKIEKVNRFIQEELKFQRGLILPKKLNTYFVQLKKRVAFLLGTDKGKWINFETLQRTTCYLKKMFKKKK